MKTSTEQLTQIQRIELASVLREAETMLTSACCVIHRAAIPPRGSKPYELLDRIRDLQTAISEIEREVANG